MAQTYIFDDLACEKKHGRVFTQCNQPQSHVTSVPFLSTLAAPTPHLSTQFAIIVDIIGCKDVLEAGAVAKRNSRLKMLTSRTPFNARNNLSDIMLQRNFLHIPMNKQRQLHYLQIL